MIPIIQAPAGLPRTVPDEEPASSTPAPGVHPSHSIHAPAAGETASRINDYRDLFKFRVTSMVVITAWAGFYLGSMMSGISSVQRGLLDTLIGIALATAGSSALNEAMERKTDALMLRTAQRPMAAGRISLAHGIILGLVVHCRRWRVAHDSHQPDHRDAYPHHGVQLRGCVYTPEAPYNPCHLHRSLSRSDGPPARLDGRARPHRMACSRALRDSIRLAVSSFHGHRLALSGRLRPRRNPACCQ